MNCFLSMNRPLLFLDNSACCHASAVLTPRPLSGIFTSHVKHNAIGFCISSGQEHADEGALLSQVLGGTIPTLCAVSCGTALDVDFHVRIGLHCPDWSNARDGSSLELHLPSASSNRKTCFGCLLTVLRGLPGSRYAGQTQIVVHLSKRD